VPGPSILHRIQTATFLALHQPSFLLGAGCCQYLAYHIAAHGAYLALLLLSDFAGVLELLGRKACFPTMVVAVF
jgi:hypothetical protein